MSFEGAKIRTTRNAASPIDGPREDLVAADVIVLSMVSLPQTPSTYEWSVLGRPEGSVVGGGGTNPWPLSSGSTATFTVDSDPSGIDAPLDGTYTVQCVLNKGSSMESRFSVVLRRATGIELPPLVSGGSNRKLAKPGMFESLEDLISQLGVIGGWSTMTTRWFEWIRLALGKSGPDLASATNLLLPPAVGSARVTGTTTIDYIRITGRRPGSRWTLHFISALTIRHNIGSVPAGSAALNLAAAAASIAITANSVWQFWYDGDATTPRIHAAVMKAG
jgi:hypothetical protein